MILSLYYVNDKGQRANVKGVPQNEVANYAYLLTAKALGYGTAKSYLQKNQQFFSEYTRANGQRMAAQIWAEIETGKSGKSDRKSGGTGTGFFINKQGHIVTNSHVVKDCKQINTLYQGSKVSTSLVTNDPRNDLALLKASTRPSAIAYFRSGRGIRAGDDILAFGYPLKSVLSDELKGTKGMINALSGLNNDTRFMQMSAPVQPGNSGGPLLDQAGNVVGVVTAKLNAVKMAKHTGDIPQNVNFALKASLVRDMLEVKDIDYETASSKKKIHTTTIFHSRGSGNGV